MRQILVLAMCPVLVAGVALASFSTPNWTDVNSYYSLGTAGNVIMTYDYTGADFTIGDVSWTGDGEAFGPSYASEADVYVTAPSGATGTLNLATGSAGLFTSSGSSDVFAGEAAVGTWTFEFFESYDDGSVDPDATHYNIQFDFAEGVAPPTMAEMSLGNVAFGSCVNGDNTGATDDFGWSTGFGDDVWTIEHDGGEMILDLNWDGLPDGPDMDLQLYDVDEVRVAYSWNVPGPENITEDLPAGTYYALVDGYDGEAPYELCYTPEPASLLLLGVVGLLIRRR